MTVYYTFLNLLHGVTLGGCLGHFICTGFACLGGRLIAQKISIKHITIFGGFVFLAFAIHGFTTMMLDGEADSLETVKEAAAAV